MAQHTPAAARTKEAVSPAGGGRPSVSVVVPFAGSSEQGATVLERFAALELRDGDEVVISDNSADEVLGDLRVPGGVRIVTAPGEGSPARARNAGAVAARATWILFVDSDCVPPADLLDRFFHPSPAETCALVAGEVVDAAQDALTARFSATRGLLDQRVGLRAARPYALTANLLVRRDVWRELGGFLDGIFNGEDVDFCWRAQRAGWSLEFRPEARVAHEHRETVAGLLRQARVRRASARWVHRRWPDADKPPLRAGRRVARGIAGGLVFGLRGQRERAALKLLDAAYAAASAAGEVEANRARPRPRSPRSGRRAVQVWVDEFPVVSETFVVNEARELAAAGHAVVVRAGRRPAAPALGVFDVEVHFAEDDTTLERALATARLMLRRPLGCMRDLRDRRAWRSEEAVPRLRELAPSILRILDEPDLHLHAHFAAGAALGAMRAARIAGRTWSVACHGYDIYKLPRNLALKTRAADLVVVPCLYCARDLREVVGPERAERVHQIVMGVDADRFRRATPHPADGPVLAVGRLVEKKGFVHLVRAMAQPELDGARLEILGEGPELPALEAEVARLGLGDRVALRGRAQGDEVRAALERAVVLAMPCVVAADGDRDSMPVVVKEAMAMEVPVVVTDEVGLPELVDERHGRVVPPADPAALAGAIAELLALDPADRAAIGRAGRSRVLAYADVRSETRRLAELLEALRR